MTEDRPRAIKQHFSLQLGDIEKMPEKRSNIIIKVEDSEPREVIPIVGSTV